jgi:hypothetical protein
MTATHERANVRKPRVLAGLGMLVLLAFAVVACNDAERERSVKPRFNSTSQFEGERRDVAMTLEAFERAVLAEDREGICDRLLRVRQSRDPDNDNGGRRFCLADPANDPERELRRAGGDEPYDVIVRRVEVRPRRGSAGQIRRALVQARIGSGQNAFLLGKHAGRWEVLARSFGEVEQSAGTYDLALGCTGRGEIHVSTFALGADAEAPREAVIEGPFGDRIRHALSREASLSLTGVTYAPDYEHIYLLRDARGRPRWALPVTVYRFGSFDASTMAICSRRDAQRISRQRVPALLRSTKVRGHSGSLGGDLKGGRRARAPVPQRGAAGGSRFRVLHPRSDLSDPSFAWRRRLRPSPLAAPGSRQSASPR